MSTLDRLSLHQLRALDQLLELRSVTRTAERLAVSQSALSHTLRGLREVLDDPLFVRVGGGLRPTPRAEALRGPLRTALRDLAAALRPAVFDPATATGCFTLGMTDAFAMLALPRLLRRLRAEAPGLNLDVRSGPVNGLARDLEDGALDLVLTVGPPDVASIKARVFYRDSFSCLLWSAHPDVERLDLDRYCALPHALISPNGEGEAVVDIALAALGRQRRVAVRVRSFLAAPALLQGTDLVLTLPDGVAKALVGNAPLRLLPPPLALPRFPVHLVWHQRLDADPAHRWFRGLFGMGPSGR